MQLSAYLTKRARLTPIRCGWGETDAASRVISVGPLAPRSRGCRPSSAKSNWAMVKNKTEATLACYRFPKCKNYRDEAGLTKEELSRLARCSRSTLFSIEKNEPHTITKVRAVFNALNKALDGRLEFEAEVIVK